MDNSTLRKRDEILEQLRIQTLVATRRREFPILFKDFLKARLVEEFKSSINNEIEYNNLETKIPEYKHIDLEKYQSKPNTSVDIYGWLEEVRKINRLHTKSQHTKRLQLLNQDPLVNETI